MSQQISPNDLTDITVIESQERKLRLGKALYDDLLSSLIDYTTLEEFDYTNFYYQGDRVYYEGNAYMASEDTSEYPTTEYWVKLERFNSGPYNALWGRYLGRYLAMQVVKFSIPRISTQLTFSGTVKIQGETFQPASENSVKRLQSWLDSEIARTFVAMHDFLTENKADYPLYMHNQEDNKTRIILPVQRQIYRVG